MTETERLTKTLRDLTLVHRAKRLWLKLTDRHQGASHTEQSEWSPQVYRPEDYWQKRLGSLGGSLQGPGRIDLTESENRAMYRAAEDSLSQVMSLARIDVSKVSIGEIGCGNGYWTKWVDRQSPRSYTGFDITDVLFPHLTKEFPNFTFLKLDITKAPLPLQYDLVLMLDVTQHIVDEEAFQSALRHVADDVGPRGTFITTSWLSDSARNTTYEKSRSLPAYAKVFSSDLWNTISPLPYRDKFIIAFARKN